MMVDSGQDQQFKEENRSRERERRTNLFGGDERSYMIEEIVFDFSSI
jgi:hypothetical protein